MGNINLSRAIRKTCDQQIDINRTLTAYYALLEEEKAYINTLTLGTKDYESELEILENLQKGYDGLLSASNHIDNSLSFLRKAKSRNIC